MRFKGKYPVKSNTGKQLNIYEGLLSVTELNKSATELLIEGYKNFS